MAKGAAAIIPRSVMNPETSRAGVTSKPQFRTWASLGVTVTPGRVAVLGEAVHLGDLVGAALLDRDHRPRWRAQVERGRRGGDEERHVAVAGRERPSGRSRSCWPHRRWRPPDRHRRSPGPPCRCATGGRTALSTTTVWGIRRCPSSHAVRAAPWLRGRVSLTQTWTSRPRSEAMYIGAVAVPHSTQANHPALQWVRISTGRSTRSATSRMSRAPISPIARHAAASSSASSSAKTRAAAARTSTGRDRMSRSIRSSALRRLTAVGRVAISLATAASRARSVALAAMANATPCAAATPMRGAPRTCMTRMPSATSSTLRQRCVTKRWGRWRWSITDTAWPSHQMVRFTLAGPTTAADPTAPLADALPVPPPCQTAGSPLALFLST